MNQHGCAPRILHYLAFLSDNFWQTRPLGAACALGGGDAGAVAGVVAARARAA
jgi:hypothetical protein